MFFKGGFMKRHPDPECDKAIIQLLDALCSWERSTGRESLLVLIPVEQKEQVIIADSGTPITGPVFMNEMICKRVEQALAVHDNPKVHSFVGG